MIKERVVKGHRDRDRRQTLGGTDNKFQTRGTNGETDDDEEVVETRKD